MATNNVYDMINVINKHTLIIASEVIDLGINKVNKSGDTMTGNLLLNNQSKLQLGDLLGLNRISLQSPSVVSNYTLILPNTKGLSNYGLINDGLGNLSWQNLLYAINLNQNLTTTSNVVFNSITGNVFGNLTGLILTSNQPNITQLGTLSSLTISGLLTGNNINLSGTLTGNINSSSITAINVVNPLIIGYDNFNKAYFNINNTGDLLVSVDGSYVQFLSEIIGNQFSLPSISGDAKATISHRIIPISQGGDGINRTEMILFCGDDNISPLVTDVLTLRGPGILLQTYSVTGVTDIDNDNGSNTRLYISPNGKIGINIVDTAASIDRQLEINSDIGQCLRLSYNDNNGSATNKVDLDVSSSGDFIIQPTNKILYISSMEPISNVNGDKFIVTTNSQTNKSGIGMGTNSLQIYCGNNTDYINFGYGAGGLNFNKWGGISNGKMHLNTLTSSARLQIQDAFEQLRLEYDNSNYMSISSNSSGVGNITSSSGRLSTTSSFAIGTLSGSPFPLYIQSDTLSSVSFPFGDFNNNGQFTMACNTNSLKRFTLGYDCVNDVAILQGIEVGVNLKPICLNPAGGNIGINKVQPDYRLDINDNNGLCLRLSYSDSLGGGLIYANHDVSQFGDHLLHSVTNHTLFINDSGSPTYNGIFNTNVGYGIYNYLAPSSLPDRRLWYTCVNSSGEFIISTETSSSTRNILKLTDIGVGSSI